MVARVPHPALRGQVRRMAGFAERVGGPVARRELPHAGVPVILGFDERVRLRSATGSGQHAAFVAGLHEIPVDTEHDGTLRCLQLDLSPLGAYRLLGVPPTELRDAVVPLDELGAPWRDLAGRLADAPGWPERFALLEGVLGRLAQDGRRPDPEVGWAWRRLAHSHGAVPMAALADEVGWSRRHLTARFHQQVGLPPKAAARVLRFSRARSLLGAAGPGSISEVAAESGYADHSHLVREFRRLSGGPPSALLTATGSPPEDTATA